MGDREAREEWFDKSNETVDLMFHLDPFERYEFAMLKENLHKLSDFLVAVETGKRFYAYRWLIDWYINLKGSLPNKDSLSKHLDTVKPDPRIDYQQVAAIQQAAKGTLTNLPEASTVNLPETQEIDLSAIGTSTGLEETFPTPADDIEEPSPVPDKLVSIPLETVEDKKVSIPLETVEDKKETDFDLDSKKPGYEILDTLVRTRRSTLLIGDTGAGKSVTQAYVITKLFERHPHAQVFVLAQKADSFCGLAEKGRVTIFDIEYPDSALTLIADIWGIYDKRRRLPESERSSLFPVRLILADWLSINQALESLKNEESVKGSKYISKLADIIYNGRELNVCLVVDLQSYNLAAVGLKADRNSRKNFNLIGLGNYSVDELGMVNESYGVLTNLITDSHVVAEESERSRLTATFKQLQPLSKTNRRPIIFSGAFSPCLALLPDLRCYKSSRAGKPETLENVKQKLESILSVDTSIDTGIDTYTVETPKTIADTSGSSDIAQIPESGIDTASDTERYTPADLPANQVKKLIVQMQASGLSQTQTIQALWGVEKNQAGWKAAYQQFKLLSNDL